MESFNPDTDETSDVNNGSDYADLRRMLPGMFGAEQDDDESNAIPIGQRIVAMGGADPSDWRSGVQRVDDEDFAGPANRNFGSDDDRAPQGDESARLTAHNIDAGLGFGDPTATETDDGDEFGDPLAAYRSNDSVAGGAIWDGEGENAEYGDLRRLSESGQGQVDEDAVVGGESEPDGEEDSDTASEEEEPSGADEDAAAETNAEPEAVSPAAARGGKHSGTKPEPVPVPVLKGSVGGKGATNNPEDVKAVQRLLNLAVANGEDEYKDLARFGKIPEDGKITPKMLEMLQAFQRSGGSAGDAVLDPQTKAGQRALRGLAKNPFADPRWSRYDDVIRREVDYYNKFFSDPKVYPGFTPLDWRLVKAMVWQESGGPDYKPAQWGRRPMQIGRFARDKGFEAVKTGAENTRLFVPQELRDKLNHQPMDGELNVRAGIAYLYDRARPRMKTQVDDPTVREETLTAGDKNPIKFAVRTGTTGGERMIKD